MFARHTPPYTVDCIILLYEFHLVGPASSLSVFRVSDIYSEKPIIKCIANTGEHNVCGTAATGRSAGRRLFFWFHMFYDNDKSFRFVLITGLTTVHASLCSVRQRGQAAVKWGRSLANRFSSCILNDLIQVDRFEQSHLLLAGNRKQVRVIVKCLRAVPPSFWGVRNFFQLLYTLQTDYGRQVLSRFQVRKDNEFSISLHPRNKRGHSSKSQNIPLPELWYSVYVSGIIQRSRCQNGKLWQQHSTSNLFVLFAFLFSLFVITYFRSPS